MLAQLCARGPKQTIGSYQFLSHVDLLASMGVVVKVWRPERKVTGSLNSDGGSWRGERRCCCVICYVRTGQICFIERSKEERMTRKGFFLNGQDVFTCLLIGSGKSGITKWFDLIGWCCPMMDINSSSNNLTIMTWKCLPFFQTVFKNSFPYGLVQQTMWWVMLEPSIRIV